MKMKHLYMIIFKLNKNPNFFLLRKELHKTILKTFPYNIGSRLTDCKEICAKRATMIEQFYRIYYKPLSNKNAM